MAVVKEIVCLANSRKHNGRCIAGIEIVDGRRAAWVRPVSDRTAGEVSEFERQYPDRSEPRVLDIVEVPLRAPLPDGYQVENWLLDPEKYWILTGRCTWERLAELADAEDALWPSDAPPTRFGVGDRVTASTADRFSDSLRLIRVEDLTIKVFVPGADRNNQRRRVQGQFSFSGAHYRTWVTDPVVERDYLARVDGEYAVGECYLTMSLGERSDDGYCYKLIAAAITRSRTTRGAGGE